MYPNHLKTNVMKLFESNGLTDLKRKSDHMDMEIELNVRAKYVRIK